MDFFNVVFRRVQGFFKSLLTRLTTSLSKLKRLPQLAAKKAKDILKGILDFLIKKPSALTDYIKLGKNYIAKRTLFFLLLLISAIILLIIWLLIPFLNRTFFGTHIIINSAEFFSADGKVQLYNEDGTLLYTGDMKSGTISGYGKLYDDGKLVYDGNFLDNEYSGDGKAYYDDGTLSYVGGFENSLFSGKGTCYNEDGTISSVGEFADGKLSGVGSTYDEDGKLIYKGDFVEDEYSGNGQLYKDEKLLYSGGFEDGKFSGQGRLYDENGLVYDGAFVDDKFSGKGTLYDENGNAEYTGDFINNEFSGDGTKSADDGTKITGAFENGKANGAVVLYDENGTELFSGSAKDGKINYASYISSPKSVIESTFTSKCTVRKIDSAELYFYPDLNVGFLFNGKDTVDRIIVTGGDVVNGAENGLTGYTVPDNAELYSDFAFAPNAFDRKVLSYIGIDGFDKLRCEKYIISDGVFVKLYYIDNKIAYYETGAI